MAKGGREMTTAEDQARAKQLESLQQRMAANSMAGHWESHREGRGDLKPDVWRWPQIMSFLGEAGDLVEIGRAGWDDLVEINGRFYSDRRTVMLENPGAPGSKGASRTIQMSIQLVKPGEVAEAHRHTFNALRFVVQAGEGMYTTVDGEQIMLEPGDLASSPNWSWHDHVNPTDKPTIWLDVHDARLSSLLCGGFKENWAEGPAQPITKPDGYSRQRLGVTRPQTPVAANKAPPYSYKWTDTLKALEEMAAAGESDPHEGILLEYTNPLTGGPTVPTISCRIQMLRPGEATRPHRHTGSAIYHVVRGQGVTPVAERRRDRIDGVRDYQGKGDLQDLEWGERDCFTVPSWAWHEHRNLSKTEPVILFSICDRPALEALGFYQEEKG